MLLLYEQVQVQVRTVVCDLVERDQAVEQLGFIILCHASYPKKIYYYAVAKANPVPKLTFSPNTPDRHFKNLEYFIASIYHDATISMSDGRTKRCFLLSLHLLRWMGWR
jgi:hypothetical protein